MNTENKLEWCKRAEQNEREFAVACYHRGIGVTRNVTKVTDVYAADLLATLPSDLKTVRTPFFTSSALGVPASYAITLNVKDVQHYQQRHPIMLIFFDIQWDSQENYGTVVDAANTLRVAFLPTVVRWIKANNVRRHTYARRVDDTQGNAKDSYVLDYRWLEEIGEDV